MIRRTREKYEVAQEIIQDLGWDNLLSYFRQRLTGAKSLATRNMLVEAYARLAGAEAIPTLVEICQDVSERSDVRAAAIQALGSLEATEAIDTLVGILNVPDSYLRIAAARALSQIRDARAVEPLIKLLYEEQSDVVTAAAEALLSLRAKESGPKLREVLESGRLDPLTEERVRGFVQSIERVSPDQLVPDAPYFIDREAELEALCRALEDEPTAVVSVVGMPGVGKTALAARVAKLVDADHKLWLRCTHWRDASDLFRELARQMAAVGETALLDYHKFDPRELRSWLRLALSRRRYLLVFDDFDIVAHDPEMHTFLRGIAYQPNVKLLITGRTSVELPGVKEFFIAGFSRAEATEFIRCRGLDLTESEVERIVKLSEGMPLYLALVLDSIGKHGKDALEQGLPQSMESILRHHMRNMIVQLESREELQVLQALRILSIFHTPISPDDEGVIAVFESEGIDFAGEVLADLGRYGFVTIHADNTFEIAHTLIRDFIVSGIDSTDRARLDRKVGEYYLRYKNDLLRAADYYYRGGDVYEAVRLLLSNIRRLINEGHAASARDLLASIVTSKQLTVEQQAEVTEAQGELAAFLGDYGRALEHYQRSLAIKEDIGDRVGLATTYNDIGGIHRARGGYDSALVWHQKSVALAEELGDRASLAISFNNIGEIHRARGDYDRALNYYQRSLAIKEELGDKSGLAVTLHNIGAVHQDKGQWGEAIAGYQHSLEIAEGLGDKIGLALGLRNLGDVTLASGEVTRALEFFARSQTLFAELGLNKQANEIKQGIDEIKHKTLDERQQLMLLLQALITRFDGEELAGLYYDLGVDYESLRGESKAAKARELIAYLERRGRLGELLGIMGVQPVCRATVAIPINRIGRLIGKGGATIKGIRDATDTRMWIDQETGVIAIEGSTQQKVDAALQRVRAIIPEAR